MNKKLVFFTVVYNPDDNVYVNISNAIDKGFDVFVYLNHASEDDIIRLKKMGINILGDNINAGLGVAFNDLETMLLKNGGGDFLYFDQDTIVGRETLSNILTRYRGDLKDNDGYSIFYTSENVEKFKSGFFPSSGCLFRINEESLMHNRSYHVECVDYEYCCQTIIDGGSIKPISIKGIDHESLQDSTEKSFLGKRVIFRVYPSSRVKDFNYSHVRLIVFSILNLRFKLAFFLIKSLFAFNAGNIKNRILDFISC
ncbi:conserved hypothetical protein [Vibrio chagasii]|uniref:hypothetical protein n=1 Tax=unclassified Vibrio TaxID=2614977 RepID=UPI0014938FD9|nr:MULTISPECIES: hypothetical protein [unclassified Vibrio]CAH6800139.1 conserved hypothetical protein [Vibrio chagasii]NOI37745.1 hypothetical protein [Vibrio sp. 070316B]NOI88659.1 hypothetical protein [Vibrio sp. 99K-1]CAH6859637.1 conserved hypothetical protein [Vibrio chagasii]CAH6868472.1 conserved hypothetical protein [Vibrio chagasii]